MKDATELDGSENDIFKLLSDRLEEKSELPRIYLWCGTEDSLIEINRFYRDLLTSLDIPHRYEESAGTHNWKYWDAKVNNALDYLLSEE